MPAGRGSERRPALGDLMYDTGRKQYGIVMDRIGEHIFLRPSGGGIEWQVTPDEIAAVPASETLGPRVAEANARSRREGSAQ